MCEVVNHICYKIRYENIFYEFLSSTDIYWRNGSKNVIYNFYVVLESTVKRNFVEIINFSPPNVIFSLDNKDILLQLSRNSYKIYVNS